MLERVPFVSLKSGGVSPMFLTRGRFAAGEVGVPKLGEPSIEGMGERGELT